MAQMTAECLRQLCKEHRLYLTPALNDKLYCNFRGFGSVGGLEEYVNLKALFLEGNALDSLGGLPPLPQLKCLYAQNNLLGSLDGLCPLPGLDTLNVSGNQLASLDGLERLPGLHTLVAAGNRLEAPDALAALAACTQLESLDLQDNGLADADAALALLRALPQLRCLYLKGNPLVSRLASYRKTLIAALPALSYLDDRPVFEKERRCAEAWARGGVEAEREERERCVLEEQQRERRNFEALQRMREEGFRKRREALGLPPGTTDPVLDGLDDSEWQFEEEPEELRAARERLAAYTAAAAARAGQEEDEALPELAEGSGAAPGGSAPLFEAPGSQEDMQVVLEERAASLAALQQPDKEEALAAQALAVAGPAENANPNGAGRAVVSVGVKAGVPEARVTVAVAASGCRSAPNEADEEATSSGEAAAAEEPRGQDWEAGVVEGLAEPALRPSSPSEVGSESVASDEEDNLEALD